MAFWDNFEKKATDATANVMSKVKGVSDITRLNSMVTEEENRIKDIYFKIGQTYVKLHGQDNDPGFSGLLNALKASQLKIEKYKQEIMDIKGVQKEIGWGSQIRSYVLDDSRIKDLRTGVETRNTQAVLDGSLDQFIEASLKAGL